MIWNWHRHSNKPKTAILYVDLYRKFVWTNEGNRSFFCFTLCEADLWRAGNGHLVIQVCWDATLCCWVRGSGSSDESSIFTYFTRYCYSIFQLLKSNKKYYLFLVYYAQNWNVLAWVSRHLLWLTSLIGVVCISTVSVNWASGGSATSTPFLARAWIIPQWLRLW